MRWAAVLAGGVGSRFWPLSTAARPKQLLPLVSGRPLLAESVARVLPLIPAERVLVVTSRALAPAVRAVVPELPAQHVLAEPSGASTAPALAWATTVAARADADASVLSLHADWSVIDPEGFRRAASAALDVAEREDVLVTVGARPDRPEIGYGYIVLGAPVGTSAGWRIARFVEKPSAERAAALIREGALWNTGLFAWTAGRFRAELAAHTPEVAGALPSLDAGDVEAFYRAVTPVSVDVGLFERTARGAALAGDFGWDDVGSWAALRRLRPRDARGNVVVGEGHTVDTNDSVVWSEDGATVVDGLDGVVVVRSRGITLVTTAARAADLKRLLDRLPSELAGERGA